MGISGRVKDYNTQVTYISKIVKSTICSLTNTVFDFHQSMITCVTPSA